MADSHLSTGKHPDEGSPPVKQHHRLALGEKVTGTSNPYGTAKASTANKVANNGGKTY